MNIIQNKQGKNLSIRTKELDLSNLSSLNKTALNILKLLSKKSDYPKNIARQLNLHEQNVYYFIRKLEKSGFIQVKKTEEVGGISAKIYEIVSDSFFFKFNNFSEGITIQNDAPNFLQPFIKNGNLNSLVVLGSQDPHGENMARSRDNFLALELILFLGSFLKGKQEKIIKSDVNLTKKELESNNLIIIGGPVVNKVSLEINPSLPIKFNQKEKNIFSKFSKKAYSNENVGIVIKMRNPFNKEKFILFLAGNKILGTKTSFLAVINNLTELEKPNYFSKNKDSFCHIVEGIDSDFDGEIDSVRFLE